jgi:TM2 domain-containing membrane protein YozV
VLRFVPVGSRIKKRSSSENQSSKPSSGIAAVLSLIIPGAGQMYRGRAGAGLAVFCGSRILLFYLSRRNIALALHR